MRPSELIKQLRLTALTLCVIAVPCLQTVAQQREVERPTGGVVDFLAPIEPDPILQHSKVVYVSNGCAYCHGVDLRVRNGEAANLLQSTIVAADVNANIIGPLLRNGIAQTAKLSPMPQFKDLSDKNIEDLARWIHYARQLSRFNDLKAAGIATGDAAAGKALFQQNCSSCHSEESAKVMVRQYPATELRARMLRPAALNAVQSFTVQALHDEPMKAARQRHGAILENATQRSVSDTVAYLSSLK